MLALPDLTLFEWTLVVIGATGIGISKSGFSGVNFVHIIVFALIFGPRESTGLILPMLVVGDIAAVVAFRQHARWDYIRQMFPPACFGVVVGTFVMARVNDGFFTPFIGWILVVLTTMQLVHMWKPGLFAGAPQSKPFAWVTGLLAGCTTMMANGAGPIIALFALAVGLPKFEFVGTSAWFFLIINVFKLPFSYGLGLIHGSTLSLNLILIPAILCGIAIGRWLTHIVPQRTFNALLLVFAGLAALRLIGVF
jgi:uncharacterized membrane protein YfcA